MYQVSVGVVKIKYVKNTEYIALSVSVNASKILPLMKIDLCYGVSVGSSAPDRFIDLISTQEDINDILKKFHGKDIVNKFPMR